MRRGEIWWYEHPDQGRRPHLILTRTAAIPVLRQLITVPATTTVRGIPTEVSLGLGDGMPRECVLTLDNVTLARRDLLVERITELDASKLKSVCDALSAAIDC